ncbi:hypothetical protein G9C98_000615 [Cotesia typhae]|uniref:Uncharacterized protein n=1 Tax=Cotesia typhae TaxID=2053667 RepID=A0A8J5V0A9_9HYME|nr:hypothetical protein G9C98_000615 [Cotesia typhae]
MLFLYYSTQEQLAGQPTLWESRVVFCRSMLNSTNALEGHIPPAESAALMVAEEKPHPDSFVFAAGSERSSIAPAQPERAPPPLPPPRFPNSGV